MNKMKEIRIDKVTLNVGAGKSNDVLEKGFKLLSKLSGVKPVRTSTKKRIAAWGLRPGLPIGCKVTLRGKRWEPLLKRLIAARDNKLSPSQIDENGNIAFGIHECIDIPDWKYDPEIGIMGMEVCVTLERPGFRVKKRRIRQNKVGKKHKITKAEAIDFMKKEFNIILDEEGEK
ncbi:MAG: 50S ribosomal protein L5 [Nanoarchaeota archaeon]|nr:50S ribosomal protein L5 [Nanoarchaeota archaeon]